MTRPAPSALFPLLLALLLPLALPAPARALTDQEQLRFADGIFLRGLYEPALSEYLLLLRDFPDSPLFPTAVFRTGECYRHLGNTPAATRFYNRLLDESPDSPHAPLASLHLAEFDIAAGDYPAAATRLDALLASPDVPADARAAATYSLALARWKSGDASAAHDAYASVLADYPSSPYASFAALDLAALHDGQKKYAADIPAWFETAANAAPTPAAKAEALLLWASWAYRRADYASAASVCRSLLVECPSTPAAARAPLTLAWSLYFLGEHADALEQADALLAGTPAFDAAASAAFLRAHALRALNRDGEALAAYAAVLADYPASSFAPRAAFELMATHFKRADWARALSAAPLKPLPEQEADVLWMRAESERNLSRPDDAERHYRQLAADFPDSPHAPEALFRAAEALRDARRYADAADAFAALARDYPSSPVAPAALDAAASAALRADRPQAALDACEALLASPALPKDNRPDALLRKALALLALDRDDDAARAFGDVIDAAPDSAPAAQASGWLAVLAIRQEQWARAEDAARTALSHPLLPADAAPKARLALAQALQRQNRMDEAADQIEPLLEHPDLLAGNPALVDWLVRTRYEQGQLSRALSAARELALNAVEPTWRQIAWYWVGLCRTALSDPTAREAFAKAAEEPAATREGAEALLALAALDLEAADFPSARARYSAAAEKAADDDAVDLRARAYFGLGETEEAAGNPEAAARHFMAVAVLFDDPELSPHALFRAHDLYLAAGKPALADSATADLRARYPTSAFALRLPE